MSERTSVWLLTSNRSDEVQLEFSFYFLMNRDIFAQITIPSTDQLLILIHGKIVGYFTVMRSLKCLFISFTAYLSSDINKFGTS